MVRPSEIYRSSRAPTYGRARYKFPILEPDEIIEVFEALDFGISESMLAKPTSSFMNTLVEQLLDKFLYVPPHSLRKKVEESEIEDRGEEEGIHASMNIVAPKRIVYKFLCDCGVDDFNIRDVAKPNPNRVRIILSAVINFARFREERMNDCDGLLEGSDGVVVKYREELEKNNHLKARISEAKNSISSEGYTLNEVNERNNLLETRLKELRENQRKLAAEHAKYKSEKVSLIKELENHSALYIATEKDLEQVRPYIKESPESVKELIKRMKDSLKDEQEKVKQLEDKSRKIAVSLDSFQLLIQEFRNLSKALEETQIAAKRMDDANKRLKQIKDEVEENDNVIKEATRNLAQVQRQLGHNEERTQKLAKFFDDKLGQLQGKLQENGAQLSGVKRRRLDQDTAIATKKAQIEAWRGSVSELKRDFETECKEASFELEKLSSHIKLYNEEITKKIDEQRRRILDK